MEMQLFFVILVDILGITSCAQPNNGVETGIQTYKASSSEINRVGEIENNFRNLFDSIQKSNTKKTKTYLHFLRQEAAQEQQAFDSMKGELGIARQNSAYRLRNFYYKRGTIDEGIAALKREIPKNKNERVSTNITLLGSEAASASDDSAINYGRHLSCPIKIRDTIEKYPIIYFGSQGMITSLTQRQNSIHQKIKKWLKPEIKHIKNAVIRLGYLSLKEENEKKKQFKNAWLMLKDNIPSYIIKEAQNKDEKKLEEKPGNINTENINEEALEIKPTYIRDAIIQVASAKDENEARKHWDEQCLIKTSQNKSAWEVWSTMFTTQELETLKQLISTKSDKDIKAFLENNNFSNLEQEYARDMIQVQRVLEKVEVNADKYKMCLLTLYFSTSPKILTFHDVLRANKPTLDRASQFESYCWNFARLYDIVSMMDKHIPGILGPEECQPQSEDFKLYINYLASKQSKDVAFVAQSLYSSNEELQKKLSRE